MLNNIESLGRLRIAIYFSPLPKGLAQCQKVHQILVEKEANEFYEMIVCPESTREICRLHFKLLHLA
jgi:hypothetical protein